MVLTPAILVLAAVFAGAGFFWFKSQPTSYSSESASILLIDHGTKENPYTYFPKSVILTGQIVASRLSEQTVRDEIQAAGGVHDYSVLVHNDGNQWVAIYTEPTITVTAVSTDPDALARTQSILLARMRSELEDLQVQAGATPAIKVQVLSNGAAYALHGRPSRALAMIAVLSLWCSALLVRASRRWWLRRRADRLDVPDFATPDRSAPDREVELVGA